MENFIILIVATLSALVTQLIHLRFKQGPVRSSALVSLLVAGFFHLFPAIISFHLTKHIPVVVIGASFIGMATADRLGTFLGTAFAGLIFGIIYLNTSRYFEGYGGALGTSACISVLVAMSIPFLTSKRKLTVGFLQLRRLLLKRKRSS